MAALDQIVDALLRALWTLEKTGITTVRSRSNHRNALL
jgi:hypothetical protein